MSGTPPRVPHTWPDVLGGLVAGVDLDRDATAWAMVRILSGEATSAQIAGFAVALRAKGETVAEVEGLVETMYAHAAPLHVEGRTVDIVGTGGDRAHTVNISSMSAVVMAGSGATVVKHGNRAASSSSGSADVLEALGVRLDVPADQVGRVATEVGITFCFAPVFHPSLRYAGAPRKELGIPTPFNVLGPLTNPSRPSALAVGCADPRMAPIMAGVLARRGVEALVVRGDDGLDEITTADTTTVWQVSGGSVEQTTFDPASLGIGRSPIEALRGGDAQVNAQVFRDLLAGREGPVRDAVVMNASAGLAAYDAAGDPALGDLDLVERLGRARERVVASIDSGAAARVLERWVEVTSSLVTR